MLLNIKKKYFSHPSPGYSSQAPRNRKLSGEGTDPTEVPVANFHHTRMDVKSEGFEAEDKTVMKATRSAITVEFDVNDPEERAKVNKHLFKQVLDAQAKDKLDGMKWEDVITEKHKYLTNFKLHI